MGEVAGVSGRGFLDATPEACFKDRETPSFAAERNIDAGSSLKSE
jgi:hypothetical protein